MSWMPPQYSDDYVGYPYDDPTAPTMPITKDTATRALDEGRAARNAPVQTYMADGFLRIVHPLNPYAGKSMVLSGLWRSGYTGQDGFDVH